MAEITNWDWVKDYLSEDEKIIFCLMCETEEGAIEEVDTDTHEEWVDQWVEEGNNNPEEGIIRYWKTWRFE